MKLRELVIIWADTTWGDQLKSVDISESTRLHLKTFLINNGLLDETISGYSVTGLKKTDEQRLKGLTISYSEAFEVASGKDLDLLPLHYLATLTENYTFERGSVERY